MSTHDAAACRMTKRLAELAALEEGWHDGEGRAPNPAQLQWLQSLWGSPQAHSWPAPFLYPTLEGGVLLEWDSAAYAVSVEFAAGARTAEVLVVDLQGVAQALAVDASFDLQDGAAWTHLFTQLRPWLQPTPAQGFADVLVSNSAS